MEYVQSIEADISRFRCWPIEVSPDITKMNQDWFLQGFKILVNKPVMMWAKMMGTARVNVGFIFGGFG